MTTQISVYPNPFGSTLSFEVVVQQDESVIVRMLDQKQRIIKLMSWSLKKGTNKTSFDDLDELPSGNYYIDITGSEGKTLFNTKLVKPE